MSINDFRREMIGDVRGEVCRELLDRLIQETNERKSNLKKQLEAAQQERQDKFYQLSQKKSTRWLLRIGRRCSERKRWR